MSQTSSSRRRRFGFSLVELSVVLVIIGFIAGGVVVGQDLIKAAEVRSVVRDISTYKEAIYTMTTKYDCLPGDCPKATTYFGARNANNATCLTMTPAIATPTLTCNGDGDQMVDDSTEEMYLFWQHLADASLINGQYTGIHGGASVLQHTFGTNSPASALAGVGFGFGYLDMPVGSDNTYGMNYGNMFWLGKLASASRPQEGFFTPKEAYSFDKKIDDGRPATGFVMMRSALTGALTTAYWGQPNDCTTSTSSSDYSGTYDTAHTAASCSFMIKSGF